MSLTKNSLISILAASVMLLSVTACSNTENAESNDTTTTAESTTAITTTTTTEETQADYELDEADLYALELLNCYADEEGKYCVDENVLESSDDYDLFREYFFGTWEGYCFFANSTRYDPLVIDDTEQSYLMTDPNAWYSGFYKISDRVIAFLSSAVDGGTILWLDTENPETMYVTAGSLGSYGIWSVDENGRESNKPVIYTLTKTDIPVNEPEDGFLSIFRVYELSRDYGIDLEMLTYIGYRKSDKLYLCHDAYANFYPMYLVSEEPDKLVINVVVWNGYLEAEEAEIAEFTIEKIDGEWTRTVEIGTTY